jgi:predicted SnoaL-like aldol condensation-catalyzing enzyme
VLQTLNNGQFRYVTADIFDTDDDARLIEHWDMIQEIADDTVSGHSQIDGPTEPTDLDKTEENKALVRAFLDDVLKNGRSDRVTQYISGETCIQHNPHIADGLDGLQSFLAGLAQQGHTMAYEEIHNVIGCGDFVAALSKMNLAGADMAVIDLFRVADGRIVEHWDVMEEITPEETWVNSGKF